MDQPAIRFNVNYTTGSEDLKGATSSSIRTASVCVLCTLATLTERWDGAYRSSREGKKTLNFHWHNIHVKIPQNQCSCSETETRGHSVRHYHPYLNASSPTLCQQRLISVKRSRQ
jgi:hypothetical protein